ncbi:MAG: hypothetical protein JWQ73_4132, partial [Variovorax sp.]|nr:hypothetical protein [Variovorax sp.]
MTKSAAPVGTAARAQKPHTPHRTLAALLAVSLGALLLGGCAVGPDFTSPDAPPATSEGRYTPTPVVPQTVSAPGPAGA